MSFTFNAAPTQIDRPPNRRVLRFARRARQIDVDAVLAFLRLRDRRELDVEPRSVRGPENDLPGFIVRLPIQNAGPKAGEPDWVVCVET